jgi:Skp family chaperone for outer membrane proteins
MTRSINLVATAVAILLLSGSAAFAQTPQTSPSRPQFPQDARIAFVDLPYIFSATRDGKAAATELQALQHKKNADITARTKEVEALQQKLLQGGTLLNDEARGRLEREVARARVDFQRLVDDAEAEVQQAQQQFQRAFSVRLGPAIGEVAKAKNLWAVFSLGEGNVLWHQIALDISDEIVVRLDAPAAPRQPDR